MIRHHPADERLQQFATGALTPAAALAVACHLDVCLPCRRAVAGWTAVGGALLDSLQPAALEPGALERTLALLGTPAPMPGADRPLPPFLRGFDLPPSLRRQRIGGRLWLAPGIWIARVHAGDARSLSYLVYADRKTALPRHSHADHEMTTVLSGGYSDVLGDVDRGDFVETDETVWHAPATGPEEDCLSLICSDGPMRFEGVIARLIQFLAGRRY